MKVPFMYSVAHSPAFQMLPFPNTEHRTALDPMQVTVSFSVQHSAAVAAVQRPQEASTQPHTLT